jgi:cyclopropane fatty-acyl-phospholipid synthase-like methyltransferase
MGIIRRLSFDLWYLRHPPWDTGIVPPEVGEFIAAHSPGRALDLGCGTGTSCLALARAGWTVCGVDFAPRAIRLASRKAQMSGLKVEFHQGDVTHLPRDLFDERFDLILDIGCFHSLAVHEKGTYLQNLERLLSEGGTWLLYGFFTPEESPIPSPAAGQRPAERKIKLVWRRDGLERRSRPSSWFYYQI